MSSAEPLQVISVVIPARNEETRIAAVIRAIRRQRPRGADLEVIVVDDASSDATATLAAEAGAVVVRQWSPGGNPAAARNHGAAASRGDPIVFLDADCMPHEGWLTALMAGHHGGIEAVGGSLALPAGLPLSARCDYYCGWYHVHPRWRGGFVRQLPPANLSVRRAAFARTGGFCELHPVAYAHEELRWQAELLAAGARLLFAPAAMVDHHSRPGLGNLLRRSYRWGYSALPAKAEAGTTRLAGAYRRPWILLVGSAFLWPLTAVYVIALWLRVGVREPLFMAPLVLAARAAYALGVIVGGVRWLARGANPGAFRPRWE